jgi:hypothetical protein
LVRPSKAIELHTASPRITIEGGLLRIARLAKEFYEDVDDPIDVIKRITSLTPRVDLFTFLQRFPELTPQYDYPMEWDNVAAIPLTTYEHWWTTQASKNARKAVRKSEREGVVVKAAPLNDAMISGIKSIFDESPMRQGKPFWHYRKDVQYVHEMMQRDMSSSAFFGAYLGDELIGFLKLLFGRSWARSVLLLSKLQHRDKSPNNALIASAVRLSCEKHFRFLVYGQYDYGVKGSSGLLDFKRHNGFTKLNVPRYYIPLTWKGRVALSLGLHRGPVERLPQSLVQGVLRVRKAYYARQGSTSHSDGIDH